MKKLIDRFTHFIHDVMQEMKSVTWPTKADIREGTIVVIVISGIVAIFLSLVDLGFSKIFTLIF
jgi:preprotein translocase subunit SecE